MERLQKIIALSGYCSRRKAEELISLGKVKVNGEIAKLGDKANGNDVITINDKILKQTNDNKVYYLLNKPRGVVTTSSDELGRKTVIDLIETDIDINDLYDGNASVGLSGDIKFNAIDIFKNTLYNNIEMKIGNRVGAGSMNVPLVGIVAHDYVVGENESGLTYPPLTYSYYNSQTVVPVEIRSKLWEFNLGNETVKIDGTIMDIDSTGKYVSYTDETTGVTT